MSPDAFSGPGARSSTTSSTASSGSRLRSPHQSRARGGLPRRPRGVPPTEPLRVSQRDAESHPSRWCIGVEIADLSGGRISCPRSATNERLLRLAAARVPGGLPQGVHIVPAPLQRSPRRPPEPRRRSPAPVPPAALRFAARATLAASPAGAFGAGIRIVGCGARSRRGDGRDRPADGTARGGSIRQVQVRLRSWGCSRAR